MAVLSLNRENPLSESFLFVFRQKQLIGAVFLAAVLVTAVGVFLIAPTYEATVKILVKPDDRAKTAVSAGDSSPQVVDRSVSYEELLSQAAVLTSADFVTEVVQTLTQPSATQRNESDPPLLAFLKTVQKGVRVALRWSLFLPSTLYNALHGIEDARTPLQQQVAQLQGQLTVVTGRGSNLLVITYDDESPVRAAKVANTVATSYLGYYAKIFMPSDDAERFFADQSQALQEQLHTAEVKLGNFHRQHEVFDFPTQRSEVLKKLVDFEAQLKTTQADIGAEKEKILTLGKEAASHPVEVPSSLHEEPDPIITQIKSSLLNLEMKRDDLLTRYTLTSGVVREVENGIEQLKKMLAAQESTTRKATTTGLNPVHQTLDTQISLSRGQLAALTAKESFLLTQIGSYWQQLGDLDTKELELKQLEREAEKQSDAYARYVAKHEEARISAALDRSKILNLAIVETAQVPFEPASPRKALLILLAGVLGLTTGLGVAFLRERFDPTVKTLQEIESYTGLPVLAALPWRQLPDPGLPPNHASPVVVQKDSSTS